MCIIRGEAGEGDEEVAEEVCIVGGEAGEGDEEVVEEGIGEVIECIDPVRDIEDATKTIAPKGFFPIRATTSVPK